MNQQEISRRAFLRSSAQAMKGSAIALTLPMILTACNRAQQARLSGEDFGFLSEEQALEYDAISARIIPTDETPGAREAGAVYFIDNVLAGRPSYEHEDLNQGLPELQAAAVSNFDIPYFYLCNEEQQDQLLREVEDSFFFMTIRFLTIAGMFALPEYGGNKDKIGWELIGFEDRHAWAPPFGFYDADYAEKGE
jgi:gluconate 2-dehydrogenase gamma chain